MHLQEKSSSCVTEEIEIIELEELKSEVAAPKNAAKLMRIAHQICKEREMRILLNSSPTTRRT